MPVVLVTPYSFLLKVVGAFRGVMAAHCWWCDRDGWALCNRCGLPGILHYSRGDDDASTGPAVCVIVRYLPHAILQQMPSPMPALERQDIHGSFRFRDDADHHADWAASAMLPGDVEEAKRYDIASELVKLGWPESREIGESCSQDHVAESAELSGESSSPGVCSASGELAASAVSVVAQAASEKILEFRIVDGYLIISNYPSRVGILGARFDNAVVAQKFWARSVAETLVECPCGWRMTIFNFSVDAIHCPKCSGYVSFPAGKNIKISDRVLDAIKCDCGETCVWLNEADAKKLLRTKLDPNERRQVEINPTPQPSGLPPRVNRWDEIISPYLPWGIFLSETQRQSLARGGKVRKARNRPMPQIPITGTSEVRRIFVV